MVKQLDFVAYRKLKNIQIDFSQHVNIIAGTNGTCKSSILHLISNSYQKIKTTSDIVTDAQAIKVISKINRILNPKIEGLTRGDEEYNNPAPGVPGTLYKCTYDNDYELKFRRHNASDNTRFAIKPEYKIGKNDALPMMPVIYLGLFRLFAFGEFSDDESIKNITQKLPIEIKSELRELYNKFTGYNIELEQLNEMGVIKNRADFKTDTKGIDSNTISAGEDNLFIILLSLVSLKYYFESIHSNNVVESILLIDEIDKADLEFPNDLLWELDKMEFYINETKETVKAKVRPIVIITSNAEKELPDAFLRRCIFHYITFPDERLMKLIVNAHFENLEENLLEQAMKTFYKIRNIRDIRKKPSTSEFIDWIRALMIGGVDPDTIEQKLPYLGVLIKKDEDLETVVRMNL